uniref:Uncharacterized protein n=1 Tax=Pseudictyota dubia TaxID=2749911 RepID=A0A7R9VX16_9STRA|mmetsp:Transcript_24475/g.45242  ORF Transcript_24475/g.45242 Transcript_24475/m.45242 type:complete len:345 (+) Transcript_24475:267-1301(+)
MLRGLLLGGGPADVPAVPGGQERSVLGRAGLVVPRFSVQSSSDGFGVQFEFHHSGAQHLDESGARERHDRSQVRALLAEIQHRCFFSTSSSPASLTLSSATDGGGLLLTASATTVLRPGESAALDFEVDASALGEDSSTRSAVTFGVVLDGKYPGCLPDLDIAFEVHVRVLPEENLNHIDAVRPAGPRAHGDGMGARGRLRLLDLQEPKGTSRESVPAALPPSHLLGMLRHVERDTSVFDRRQHRQSERVRRRLHGVAVAVLVRVRRRLLGAVLEALANQQGHEPRQEAEEGGRHGEGRAGESFFSCGMVSELFPTEISATDVVICPIHIIPAFRSCRSSSSSA